MNSSSLFIPSSFLAAKFPSKREHPDEKTVSCPVQWYLWTILQLDVQRAKFTLISDIWNSAECEIFHFMSFLCIKIFQIMKMLWFSQTQTVFFRKLVFMASAWYVCLKSQLK